MARRSSLRFLVFVGIFALLVPTPSIAAGSPDLVQNTSVKSPVSTPVLTEAPTGNTTWAGQPIETAKKNATKGYFLADYYRNSSTEPLSTITLKGKGFGQGQYGQIVISDKGLSAEIVSWSDSTIKFVLRTKSWTYAFNPSVKFSVINDKGKISAPSAPHGVAGMIQTRPWGQCTWEVAKTRLDKDFTIPLPLAYSGTEIDKTWVPAIWDAITFEKGGGSSDGHVGIISTEPGYTDKFSAPDKIGQKTLESRTYTFTIHDRNRGWDEEAGTANVSVRVDYGADGKPSAIDLSRLKVAYPARRFFRGDRLGAVDPTIDQRDVILRAVASAAPNLGYWPNLYDISIGQIIENKYATVYFLNKKPGEDNDKGYLKKAGNRWLLVEIGTGIVPEDLIGNDFPPRVAKELTGFREVGAVQK